MAYSPAVKEAKRAEAIAEIARQKDTARQVYESLANVSGAFAAMPAGYAAAFDMQEPADAARVADFQAAQAKVDNALTGLQTLGIDALGTDTEV